MTKILGNLRSYVVKVLHPDGSVNGTGFLCHPQGFAVTCYHVITPWLEQDKKEITVVHLEQTYQATLLCHPQTDAADLVLFKILAGDQSREWPYLPLDTYWRVDTEHHLESFGYPAGQLGNFSEHGISIRGTIGGLTPTVVEDVEVYPITGLNVASVDGGYSGAPVVNRVTEKVLGVVDAKHYATQAYLAPISKLFVAWPDLKRFHDVFRTIRARMAEEAQRKLVDQLKDTTFIPLGMEEGIHPAKLEPYQEKWVRENAQPNGRLWRPLDAEKFHLQSGERWILVADVGTGKTTWLLAKVGELIENTQMVPLVLSCADLEKSGVRRWSDLLNEFVSVYESEFRKANAAFLELDLRDFLDQAFQQRRLVFLLDGLDQIKERNYSDLARTAFALAGENTVLISSRPSAVLSLESDPEIKLLRLKAFSSNEQRKYFGEYYSAGRRLSALSPELARIPMLAYMIRTLARQGAVESVATRTDIYQRFVQHILAVHMPNKRTYEQYWSLSRDISKVLSALAYRALAESQPQIQRVEPELVERVLREMRRDFVIHEQIAMEALTTFGLVNLVLEHSENQLVFFTHQSFQEFLAAQYLAESKDHQKIQTVLAERWHPKWREVIRFLAGLRGESILAEILAFGDNILRGDLLLAARCLPEVKSIAPQLRDSIQSQLDELVRLPQYKAEAVQLLVMLLIRVEGPLPLGTMDRLDEWVNDSEADVRAAAVNAMAAIGRRSAEKATAVIDRIAKMVRDQHPRVNEAVIDALGELKDWVPVKVVDQIAGAIRDSHGQLCEPAFEALMVFADRLPAEAIDRLAGHLEDNDLYLRRSTVEALRRLRERVPVEVTEKIVMLLESDEVGVRETAIEALAAIWQRVPADVIAQLSAQLESSVVSVRERALEALSGLSDRLPPEISGKVAGRLEDKDWRVRTAAVKTLAAFGPRLPAQMIDRLAERLVDEDWRVRWVAVKELLYLGDRVPAEVIDGLASRLDDQDWHVRSVAVVALGTCGERLPLDGIEKIVNRLGDNDRDVRGKALEVLTALKEGVPIQVIRSLATQLENDDPGVRVAVVKALTGLAERLPAEVMGKIAARLEDTDEKVREKTTDALVQLGGWLPAEVMDQIAGLLKHKQAQVRRMAVDALAGAGERLMTEVILKIAARLKDEDSEVRRAAVHALWGVGHGLPAELIEAIAGCLQDRNREVRLSAVKALSAFGQRLPLQVIEQLAGRLKDEASGVRAAAATGMSGLGKRLPAGMIDRLAACLADENGDVRGEVVKALSGLGERLPLEVINQLAARLAGRVHGCEISGRQCAASARKAAALGDHGATG